MSVNIHSKGKQNIFTKHDYLAYRNAGTNGEKRKATCPEE
jgi:hypothetical protein